MGFWEPLFFWFFAFGALVTSCAVIWTRNPLYCALALIADFFFFAGLYVLLSAHFMAVVQVLVYGGAIMVLFLFIIMLLNLRGDRLEDNRFQIHYLLAIGGGVIFFLFATNAILAVVDMEAVEDNRDTAVAEMEEDEPIMVQTQSAIPGEAPEYFMGSQEEWEGLFRPLHADASEMAVEMAYRQRLRAWRDGHAVPYDGKYVPFNPDRQYELPPSLHPEVVEPDPMDAHQAQATPGRKGLYGTFKPISVKLVNRFVVPFELTAILLLASIVGAVILAKRRVA